MALRPESVANLMDKTKILIVDDDKNICELLRLYLEKEGYQAVLAYNGEQAIEKFSAEKPDLTLLDVMMPKLDGWEVCRRIRATSKAPMMRASKFTRSACTSAS